MKDSDLNYLMMEGGGCVLTETNGRVHNVE